MEMLNIEKELQENAYPGRGIIIGKSADGNITILTTYTALLKIDKIKEMKKCF